MAKKKLSELRVVPVVFSRDLAAEYLSISLSKLDGLLAAGVLPRRTHGGNVVIPREALEAYAATDQPIVPLRRAVRPVNRHRKAVRHAA